MFLRCPLFTRTHLFKNYPVSGLESQVFVVEFDRNAESGFRIVERRRGRWSKTDFSGFVLVLYCGRSVPSVNLQETTDQFGKAG
jgi:hypothetical protein